MCGNNLSNSLQYVHTAKNPFDFNDVNTPAGFHRINDSDSFKNPPTDITNAVTLNYGNVFVCKSNNQSDTLSMTFYPYDQNTIFIKTANFASWEGKGWTQLVSKSDLSKIGTKYNSGWKGGVSITSDGTATKIAEITLEAGSYIIDGSVSGKGIDSLYIMKDDSIITSLTIDGTRDMNERIICTVVLPTQCKMSVSARTWASNVIAGGAIDALQVK